MLVATRQTAGPLASYLTQSGLTLAELSDDRVGSAARAMQNLGAGPDSWIVADGYHFDAAYLDALRATGSRLAVIEDTPRLTSYDVDLLLDQNIGALRRPYAVTTSRLLLGPRFVMLRPEVSRALAGPPATRARPRVFVTVGASGGDLLVDRLLTALAAIPGTDVTVALGAFSGDTDALIARHNAPHITMLRGALDLTAAMRDADLAIATLGVALWELAALGVPTLVVGTTDLHAELAGAIDGYGAHRWLGDASVIEITELSEAVSALLADEPRRLEMSRLGRSLIDGRGAARVAQALLEPTPGDWSMRPAADQDAEAIWEIASDPEVRRASHDVSGFPFAAHERWYAAKLASSASRVWVATRDGTVGGFIRYDAGAGATATVSLAVAVAARGRGIGTRMLAETWAPSCAALGLSGARALVLEDNVASRRAFEKASFRGAGVEVVGGRRCAVFVRDAASGECS